ncbi:MAG: TVP38/TMEM64 family protein [Cyanobacteria bacterium J06598_3]
MKSYKKFGGFFLVAVFAAIVMGLLGTQPNWQSVWSQVSRESLVEFFSEANRSPVRGIGLFVLAHVIANAIGIPGTLLVVVGGAVYGMWWGTLWSVIGATLGAIAAFLLARYFLHGWFKRRFGKRPFFQRLNRTLCQGGLSCILVIRFSPISPFNAVNFALGLTPVALRNYALGTFIGIIPGTLAYTWLGVTGAEALSTGRLLPLVCCLTVLMLLSLLPLLMQRYRVPTD